MMKSVAVGTLRPLQEQWAKSGVLSSRELSGKSKLSRQLLFKLSRDIEAFVE